MWTLDRVDVTHLQYCYSTAIGQYLKYKGLSVASSLDNLNV